MGIKRNLAQAGISGKKPKEGEASNSDSNKFTEDEAALYDRQIRLWGMECQTRLREARILVVGLNGVGAEVVKNLALGGVKSISILDDKEVTPQDTISQFFVCGYQPGQKRSEASVAAIQELNPNVKIEVVTGDIFSKPDVFFKGFSAMMATDCNIDVLIRLDNKCRQHKVQFYCTETWGFYGYCFLDLQEHSYREVINKNVKDDQATKRRKQQNKHYCPLGTTLRTKVGEGLKRRSSKVFPLFHVMNNFRTKFNRFPSPGSRNEDIEELKKLRTEVCANLGFEETKVTDEMLEDVFGELSPICAVVGGILANEIIKGISRTGLPIHNYFLFDGNESQGVNETVIGSVGKISAAAKALAKAAQKADSAIAAADAAIAAASATAAAAVAATAALQEALQE